MESTRDPRFVTNKAKKLRFRGIARGVGMMSRSCVFKGRYRVFVLTVFRGSHQGSDGPTAKVHFSSMSRLSRSLVVLAALLCAATSALSEEDPFAELLDRAIEKRASGALAVLGLSAVPSETASTLALDTGGGSKPGIDFQAGQLGGGFTWSETFPLYLEGYVGWNRYDPVFVFSNGTEQRRTEAKWNSFALSGGIGWDFKLADHLVLRPMALIALGEVVSDATLGAFFIGRKLGVETDFLIDGGLTAGGLGGALTLAYNERWANDWEVDVTLRHTNLKLEPIGGDKDVVGSAVAETTALWSRLRVPTGYRAFDRPVRFVSEFSLGRYGGDQEEIFNTPWIAQVGFGGEIDVSKTWVPWVTTARLVARYTRGEDLEGISLGVAVSF